MNLVKGKQTFTLKKKGRDGIYIRYIRLIPVSIFPVVQPAASGKITLLPENCLITHALAKDAENSTSCPTSAPSAGKSSPKTEEPIR